MNGTEIMELIGNLFPAALTAIGSVTGSLFTVIFLRRNTSMKEFEKIKAGLFNEAAERLLQSGYMTYTEFYKANNFLNVARKADEYYSQDLHEKGPLKCDFDWLFRFYEAVGNINDEFMQDLWAKILAGEIARPDTFSLKTIDVLKNLGRSDAELFINACAHSFRLNPRRYFLPNEDEFLNKHGIRYTDIMRLNEQDLIYSNGMIGFDISFGKAPRFLFGTRDYALTVATIDGKEIKDRFNQYPFTKVGVEISSLVSKTSTLEDIMEYGRLISKRNPSYEIRITAITDWGEESVHYGGENLFVR